MTVEEAIAYCSGVTKAHSSTFYLGSRLFGSKERKAVSVIYAVCRCGDDAVDEASSSEAAKKRLSRWWLSIDRAYSGVSAPQSALEIGLTWVLKNYKVPKAAFEELYLGLESDLRPQHIETMEELMLYCRRVAGVVGLLISPIAGYRGGEETLQYAVALGQAMQLTNILRDVGEDLERGRCYLPNELLIEYGVSLDTLHKGEVTKNYIALLEYLSHITHQLYRLGWMGIPQLQGVGKTAVGVAALNYEGILRKLKQNRYDNLTRRAYLKPIERIALIPRAVYSAYAGFGI